MIKYEDSVLDYRCVDGCGVNIYNATHDYGMVCPECGGKLTLIKTTVRSLTKKANAS